MLPDAMPELVVAQAECLRRLALVPAVAPQVVLEDRAFVRLDRSAKVLDGFVVVRGGARDGRLRAIGLGLRHSDRLPRAVEGVELDVGDRLLPVCPAIDRAL